MGSLDTITICIGVIAAVYPLLAAWYFTNTTKLGHAAALMFVGEAIGICVTVLFAILAITGHLKDLGGDIQSYMRMFIFFAAIASSANLHRVIKRLNHS